jgi:hypothetical protein
LLVQQRPVARFPQRCRVDDPVPDHAQRSAVAVLLPAITLAACAVPARGAARVDPIATLRAESWRAAGHRFLIM